MEKPHVSNAVFAADTALLTSSLLPEDMTDVFPLRKSHPLAEIEVLQGEDIEPSGDI